MTLFLAFAAMLKKELIIMRRYFANTIGGIITLYLVFMLMFLGYKGIAGANASFGDGIENLIVGYVTWFMLLIAYQVIPHTVLQEAQEGTLEQLYMCPLGFVTLGAFKLISGVLVDMIIVVLLLVLIMATTGLWLNIDILSLLPFMILAVVGVSGLGFFFGGVTLLYKRIQSYLQILQFAIIGLVAAPASVSIFRWLPVTLPAHWIRQIMVQGKDLSAVPLQDWLTMGVSALISVSVGIIVYKLCETKARHKGILGHF
jgi:ABC-2 type transport system permease protein